MAIDFENDEQALLSSIAAGDERAFSLLYAQYWSVVYRYLESLVKSPEIAEELVGDIFIKIWTGRQWLSKVDNLGGFLRIIARNKALNFLKATSRENKRMAAFKADILLHVIQQPEDRLLDTEVKKIWQDAVDQLSPQRQKIFLMHREQGLSYQQIARELDITPATVKKTMFLALHSIREFLKTYYGESLTAFLLFLLI